MSSHPELTTRERILEATWHLLEARKGVGVRMSDIAKHAGVSRQAVYLHFKTRTDLMVATTQYVDEVKGLNTRLQRFERASTGHAVLTSVVDVWGNYVPEIYGIATALLATRKTDEASEVAWTQCMAGLRDACGRMLDTLAADGVLSAAWSREEAIDVAMTVLSVETWEYLRVERGWTQDGYLEATTTRLQRLFIVDTAEAP